MSLLLLLLLMIACLPVDWPAPLFRDRTDSTGTTQVVSAIATGVVVASLLLVARIFTNKTIRRLAQVPSDREAASRLHGHHRLVFFFLNLIGFGFVLIVCGWGWSVKQMLTIGDKYLPGAEFAVLAPYLVALMGSWAIFYDAERLLHLTSPNPALHREFWSRAGYVGFLLRHHVLMVFTPVLLMIAQLGVLRQYPHLLDSDYAKIGAFAGLFLFILMVPSLVPLVLGLKPMPQGRIRDRLVRAAKRLGVRYRNLYIWDTRGNLATAMVTGIFPRFRQIVFTDLLLTSLTDDEIEAVFGHEVGHVRHGHLIYYVGFLMLSFLTLGAVYHFAEVWIGSLLPTGSWMLVFTVLATGFYLFVVFGFISRRCERQADVFGCKAVSCHDANCVGHPPETELASKGRALCPTGIDIFVRALERVEEINGSARGSTRAVRAGIVGRLAGLFRLVGVCLATWQHSTISKRVEFLKSLADEPRLERQFQLRVTALRWGLLLVLAAGIVSAIALSSWKSLLAAV